MSWLAIRDAIADKIEDVSGIGEVHKVLRHTVQWEDFFKRHVKDGQVNDWEVTRTATAQEIIAVSNVSGSEPYFHDTHTVMVKGAIGLKDADASEDQFQETVDGIVAAFRTDQLLGGLLILPASVQVPVIGHASFAGVLVHYAELSYTAIERVGG